MRKILIILTGGTIGSKKESNIINVSKNNYVETFLKKNFQEKIKYKIIKPINILSENALPSDWNKIIKSIRENWEEDFSGIIITHGTDTLSYVSSALSQYFSNFTKPIVIVSSDKPLNNKKANGRSNLLSAVKFILDTKLRGVFVAFKNPNENFVSFFLGSRVQEIESFDNKLKSVDGNVFCKYKNFKFKYIKNKLNPSIKSLKKKKNKLNSNLIFSNKILIIKSFPGINYKYLNIKKNKPKAILHSLYHSGTANTKNKEVGFVSLKDFISLCNSKKIPIYFAPIFLDKKNIYQSLKDLLGMGIKIINNTSFETAYSKLSLSYGSFKSQTKISNFIKQNNFYEKIIS